VIILADLVIPADERSGSATEAGVPAFIDIIVAEQPARQAPTRDGLAWLDAECVHRFGRPFVACTDAEQRAMLEDIAWPDRAPRAMRRGVAFFNGFRDLVAAGFFSSQIGMRDLGFVGNVMVAEYHGCPPEVLRHIGVDP
jgi:hypothetical protein